MTPQRRLNFFILISAGALITACTVKVTERVETSQKAKELSAEEDERLTKDNNVLKAEKLVADAEALISPISFFYADEILDGALKADPDNRQAQFYKAFLAPFMKFRGFLTRVGDQANPAIQKSGIHYFGPYLFAKGGLKDFLNEPARAFRTEEDLQDFIGELLVEETKLVDFVKKNKNFVTHFSFPNYFYYNSLIETCYVEKVGKGTYKSSPCIYQTHTKKQVNRGDMEALAHIMTGIKIGTLFASSYDLSGYYEYMNQDLAKAFKSQRETFDFIRRVSPRLGTLRAGHKLSEILGEASDFYAGAQWLMSMQREMCDSSREHNLFYRETVCFKPSQFAFKGKTRVDTNAALQVLAESLSGMGGMLPFQEPKVSGVNDTTSNGAKIDPMAIVKKPVQDLKTLLPDSFDSCGHANGFKDETLSGLFPDGKAADYALWSKWGKCDPH